MVFPDRRGAARRAVVGLGVLTAVTVGATGASGAAAPPFPPPAPPPGAPAAAPAPPVAPPVPLAAPAEPWDSIARCETGGDWHADTGNGYHGGLQLSARTWTAHGGGQFAPQADEATREEQILVGDRVRAEQGWEAWSSCADGITPS